MDVKKIYKQKLRNNIVPELAFTFFVALLSGSIAISLFFYSFIYKPQPETAEVFSNLYSRCMDYVEKSAVFDATGLVQGNIDASGNSTFKGGKQNRTWHHAKELLVVKLREEISQDRISRQCSISLSENGKRPPLEAIGLVVLEYFSLRRKFIFIDDSHQEFSFKYSAPETVAFRSNSVDEFGCTVVHSFMVNTVGENFRANIYQVGNACGL